MKLTSRGLLAERAAEISRRSRARDRSPQATLQVAEVGAPFPTAVCADGFQQRSGGILGHVSVSRVVADESRRREDPRPPQDRTM